MELPGTIRKLSDDQWLALLIKSISNPVIESVEFPGFPPESLQAIFVGSSNETALNGAFKFYQFVKRNAEKSKVQLKPEHKFLDFGCGWGRHLRFFWKDINLENLYGCDVDDGILKVCRDTKVPGNLAHISPSGTLPYPDNFFNVIIAYSVFTHLPEDVHLHWMQELARVSAPGCIFCLTLEPRRFIDFIANLPESPPSQWHKALSRFSQGTGKFYKQFDAGKIVYLSTVDGTILNKTVYGDAVVPLSFIEKYWSTRFIIREYIDDPNKFWQAALAVQRKPI